MPIARPLKIKTARNPRRYGANQAWRNVGERRIYFRSDWEYKFACHLEFLKKSKLIKEWEHEPKTFWFESIKRGVRSYLPDFKVTNTDGTHFWVEVKGYMDARSETKIKRFRKYYPSEELTLVTKEWFIQNKSIIHEGEEVQKTAPVAELPTTIPDRKGRIRSKKC